jgi:hypothetical protein
MNHTPRCATLCKGIAPDSQPSCAKHAQRPQASHTHSGVGHQATRCQAVEGPSRTDMLPASCPVHPCGPCSTMNMLSGPMQSPKHSTRPDNGTQTTTPVQSPAHGNMPNDSTHNATPHRNRHAQHTWGPGGTSGMTLLVGHDAYEQVANRGHCHVTGMTGDGLQGVAAPHHAFCARASDAPSNCHGAPRINGMLEGGLQPLQAGQPVSRPLTPARATHATLGAGAQHPCAFIRAPLQACILPPHTHTPTALAHAPTCVHVHRQPSIDVARAIHPTTCQTTLHNKTDTSSQHDRHGLGHNAKVNAPVHTPAVRRAQDDVATSKYNLEQRHGERLGKPDTLQDKETMVTSHCACQFSVGLARCRAHWVTRSGGQ